MIKIMAKIAVLEIIDDKIAIGSWLEKEIVINPDAIDYLKEHDDYDAWMLRYRSGSYQIIDKATAEELMGKLSWRTL